jgi:coproporphyrinogen III oxidase-like Fe-S oxidoreductase
MLALRTAEGLPTSALSARQAAEVTALRAAGLADEKAGRIVLTPAGLDVHSAIAERLFEAGGSR